MNNNSARATQLTEWLKPPKQQKAPTTPLDTDRTMRLPGRVNGAAVIWQKKITAPRERNYSGEVTMAEYARHKMNASLDSYRSWCSDLLYKKIRDENREDYSAKLAVCKTPEEEKALLLREHERYLEIWQDRDEAAFYSRQTEAEKTQQTIKTQPSVPLRAAGPQFGGCLVMGLIICCPPAWPFAIMALIFGGLSGRYRKPPSRSGW